MSFNCDPCTCPDNHINHLVTWRKAIVTLLCRIANNGGGGGGSPIPPGTNHIGSVNIDNTVTVTGTVSVNEPVTVDGTVDIGNFPATQPVSGTVAVSNFPATQPVSGTVSISGTVAPTLSASTHVPEVSKAYSALNDVTYTAVLVNANALKLITITNSMDVPASISFDGATPHHTVPAGAGMVLDLASDGLTAVGNIYALRKVAGATKGEVAVGGMY